MQSHPHAASRLLPVVYDELRRLAAHRLACEAPVVGGGEQHWDGRGHFFGVATD